MGRGKKNGREKRERERERGRERERERERERGRTGPDIGIMSKLVCLLSDV